MSFNMGSKDTSGSQTQNQQTNPWAPTMPYLSNFLQQMWGNFQNMGGGYGQPTGTQTGAINTLEANAGKGDPNAGAYRQLSSDLLNTGSWTPTIQNSYQAMKDNLNPIATMDVDPTKNPEIANMLTTVRNDITNQTNQQFAAAGRDLSGANTQTLARGISQGEAPILLGQYNQNVAQKQAANQALEEAGLNTAQTGQSLDQARAGLREAGMGVGQAALGAENWGPSQLLNLEQQRMGLPFGNMGMLASLLYPMAGLGGQSYGHGDYNQQQTSMGMGMSFNPLSWLTSDERAKEDKQEIGAMLDGTPLYSYRYKGEPDGVTRIGPMAQDVEKTNPEAVADGPHGFKMVNMEAATERSRALAGKVKEARERIAKWSAADRAAVVNSRN